MSRGSRADGVLGAEFMGEFTYERNARHYRVRVLTMAVTNVRDEYREKGIASVAGGDSTPRPGGVARTDRWMIADLPRWV